MFMSGVVVVQSMLMIMNLTSKFVQFVIQKAQSNTTP